jgi:ABC-type lipoprotein export system ATPase subunit
MKHGIGNGVRNVVSFIYTSFYLISKGNAPIIFADEAYHGISESYLERFFTFVRSLCKARGIAFILITHDNRFLSYADKRYIVSEGDIVQVGQ